MPRHENGIAGQRAGTPDALLLRHKTKQRNRNQDSIRIGNGLAADHSHAVPDRQFLHPVINRLHKSGIKAPGQAERDQSAGRRAGHGGHVAQAAGQGFVPDLLRGSLLVKMNAFHHRIGLEEKPAVRQAKIEHCAIIPGPNDDRFIGRQRSGQPGNQFQFIHSCGRQLTDGQAADQPEKVRRVKQAVGQDGRQDIIRRFV